MSALTARRSLRLLTANALAGGADAAGASAVGKCGAHGDVLISRMLVPHRTPAEECKGDCKAIQMKPRPPLSPSIWRDPAAAPALAVAPRNRP